MMFSVYDTITALQYRVKALERQLAAFESGSKYQKMQLGQRRLHDYYDRRILALQKELASAHADIIRNRNNWFQVFQDVQDDCAKKLRAKDRVIEKRDRRISELQDEVRELKKRLRQKTNEVTEERCRTLDEKEKNQNLEAQLNQNFENSSTPSSKTAFRGKVPNNREKTDRKPGGQPGHEGHYRAQHDAINDSVLIEAPEEILNNPDYYEMTGGNSEIHKQLVSISVNVAVRDYWVKVYRNRKTGARYHAPFPPGIQDEVNYDASVKAFIFLMKNQMNVGEEKISEFIEDLTEGKLKVSRGMINHINTEFSGKTKAEQDETFAKLTRADVLYTDMTGCRMNGKLKNIVVCTDKEDVMYFYREHKGDEGYKETPVEVFLNTLVHDHDKTLYHFGRNHQECNAHHLRYLVGAMQMEPSLTWHRQMHSLLKEMNRTRENQEGRVLDERQILDFEERYDRIVALAAQEYTDNPPSKYYRKGYNLSREFRDYRKSVLYFLRHPEVDFTNNVFERCARKIGRHMAVSGTFRGNTSHAAEEYCACMGILESIHMRGGNTYQEIIKIFNRDSDTKRGNPKFKKGQVA